MKEVKEKLLKYTETLVDFCKFQIESTIEDNPALKINAADASLCFEEATRELNQALQTAIPQWQPIETAPRDNTGILCYQDVPDSEIYLIFVGYFSEGHWWQMDWSGDPEKFYDPTHWMPLPSFPTTT